MMARRLPTAARRHSAPARRPHLCCECLGRKFDPLDPVAQCPVCQGLGALDIVPVALVIEDECE